MGRSAAFSTHRSMVTESPITIKFGLHGVKPRHSVGKKDADAEQTLIMYYI